MDSIVYDAKLALRSLTKQPLFFGVVLLTFALGLGATPGNVMKSVLARALAVTAPGIAVGTVAALVLGRNLESTFRGVHGADPVVLALAASALTVIALGACLVPAREASRVEPSVALRSD